MASDVPAPPLLLKLKGDLKGAMKNKDTSRLAVLRSVLAEVMNAAKTDKPMKTDMQLVALLRKKAQSSKDAIKEFEDAKRPDLVEKENGQVTVLEEYASSVKTMEEDELKTILSKTIGIMRTNGQSVNVGQLSKELYKPDGPLDGKPVDRAVVNTLIKAML